MTNHNPNLQTDQYISMGDERVTVRNSKVRRYCDARWSVALECNQDSVLVVDDDVHIFPQQVKQLWEHLADDPDVPHGFAGAIGRRYVKDENTDVDYLYEVYMVTKHHLERYEEYERYVSHEKGIPVGNSDFILVSSAGLRSKPRIHHVGRTLRCFTSDDPEVAAHRAPSWKASNLEVKAALDEYRNRSGEGA